MAWTSIVNGQTGQAVSDKLDAEFAQLESDILSLQTGKTDIPITVLQSSDLTNQEPTALDTALQVKFGNSTTNAYLFLDTNGTITFLKAGRYRIETRMQIGRIGSVGTSLVLTRYLINNVQGGGGSAFKLESNDILSPCVAIVYVNANIDDTLKFEIMRDGSGDNSGGLYITNPNNGWNTVPSANILITKIA